MDSAFKLPEHFRGNARRFGKQASAMHDACCHDIDAEFPKHWLAIVETIARMLIRDQASDGAVYALRIDGIVGSPMSTQLPFHCFRNELFQS